MEHFNTMSNFPLLSGMIFLPLVGALFILFFVRGDDETAARNAKATALWTSIAAFILSLCVFHGFDPSQASFQLVEQVRWVKGYNISYHVGVDGISIYFIMLTTFLMPFCLLAGWNSIEMRVKEY